MGQGWGGGGILLFLFQKQTSSFSQLLLDYDCKVMLTPFVCLCKEITHEL